MFVSWNFSKLQINTLTFKLNKNFVSEDLCVAFVFELGRFVYCSVEATKRKTS